MRTFHIGAAASALLIGVSLASAQTFQQPPTGIGAPNTNPAAPTPQSQGIPFGATIPYVVSSNPPNNKKDVSPALKTITITFDQPMDVATFYWPIPLNDQTFPYVTDDPYWTNSNKTVNLPVKLVTNHYYRIPLNVSSQQVFRSATGVWLNPGQIAFWTSPRATYGASASSIPGVTPLPIHGASSTPRPGTGSFVGAAGAAAGGAAGVPSTMKSTGVSGASGAASSPGYNQSLDAAGNPPGSTAKQNMANTRKGPKRGLSGTPTPTPTPGAQ